MDYERLRRTEVVEPVDPRTLQRYVLDRFLGATSTTRFFVCHEEENGQRLALQVTTARMPLWLRQLPLVELSPKIRVLLTPNFTVLVGGYHDTTLDKVLAQRDVEAPWLSEHDTRLIFGDLLQNYRELRQHGIHHGNLCLNSIVRVGDRWRLDIVPSLLEVFSSDRNYYPSRQRSERSETYAFGVVLFECLFGFRPFEDKYQPVFSTKTYLDGLSDKTPEDCSKIYYFLKAKLRLSREALELLEIALTLSRPLSLDDIAGHPWFAARNVAPFEQLSLNEEVKMISDVEHRNLSKCLAAIDKFKAKKARLNLLTPVCGPSPQTLQQTQSMLQADFHLSKLNFSEKMAVGEEPLVRDTPPFPQKKLIRYFNNDVEGLEDEFPCRQLMKYVEAELRRDGNPIRRQRILMYGYPYAVAFELLKVRPSQPKEIADNIDLAVELLLLVSNLNYPSELEPPPALLHERAHFPHDFDYYKPKYRELLHGLYKHFLNDAIHKYNTAKKELQRNPSSEPAHRAKVDGLNSYRLCWKLLEASLIVRKAGADLDLGRIQTSERREIELGLNSLLSKYFPNKLF